MFVKVGTVSAAPAVLFPPVKKKSSPAVAAVAKHAVSGRIGRRSAQQSGLIRCKASGAAQIGGGVSGLVRIRRSFFLFVGGRSCRFDCISSLFALCSIAIRPCFVQASSAAGLVVVRGFGAASVRLRASSETVEPVPVSIARGVHY